MADSDDAKNVSQKPKQQAASEQKAVVKNTGQQSQQLNAGQTSEAKKKSQAPNKGESPPVVKKSSTPKKSATASERKFNFPVIGSLALVVALAVGAFSYLNYTQWQSANAKDQNLASENAQLRAKLDQLQSQLSQQLQQTESQLGEQTKAVQSEQKWLKEAINQVSDQVQTVTADKGKDPLFWRLAEVEYLLAVANNRILLERDVTTALFALQDADRRLEAIGDPALIPIRKLIAGETSALNSVDLPDIPGMAVSLSSLAGSIERLPLVSRERLAQAQQVASDPQVVENFQQFIDKMLQDLKGVVNIRRSDEPIEPLLPPDEQHYLAQNLSLKLEESRIALLRGDTPAFRQHLTDTQNWVQKYFDPDSSSVNNVITTVSELQTTELRPGLPDISESLRELRRWISLHQQGNSTAQHHINDSSEG